MRLVTEIADRITHWYVHYWGEFIRSVMCELPNMTID